MLSRSIESNRRRSRVRERERGRVKKIHTRSNLRVARSGHVALITKLHCAPPLSQYQRMCIRCARVGGGRSILSRKFLVLAAATAASSFFSHTLSLPEMPHVVALGSTCAPPTLTYIPGSRGRKLARRKRRRYIRESINDAAPFFSSSIGPISAANVGGDWIYSSLQVIFFLCVVLTWLFRVILRNHAKITQLIVTFFIYLLLNVQFEEWWIELTKRCNKFIPKLLKVFLKEVYY